MKAQMTAIVKIISSRKGLIIDVMDNCGNMTRMLFAPINT